MTWNKPRTIWQWLLLLTPAAVHLVIVAGLELHARSGSGLAGGQALHYAPIVGGLLAPIVGGLLAPIVGGLLGLSIAAVICVALGWWLARGASTISDRIGFTFLFTAILVPVNLGIAYAGCVAILAR